MIRPRLDDRWTRKRRTELRWNDGALAASGISLDVVCAALPAAKDLWWLTAEDRTADVLRALGMPLDRVPEGLRRQHPGRGPMVAALRGGKAPELMLTEEMAAHFGASSIEEAVERPPSPVGAALRLILRDDSELALTPVADKLCATLVEAVLQVHSFYMRREIDWSGAIDPLHELLMERGRVHLESSPTEGVIRAWLGDDHDSIDVPVTSGRAVLPAG